jgi:hypothetical protein
MRKQSLEIGRDTESALRDRSRPRPSSSAAVALALALGVASAALSQSAPQPDSPAARRAALDAELGERSAPLMSLNQGAANPPAQVRIDWPPVPPVPPTTGIAGVGWRISRGVFSQADQLPGNGWIIQRDRELRSPIELLPTNGPRALEKPCVLPVEDVFWIGGRGTVRKPRELRR